MTNVLKTTLLLLLFVSLAACQIETTDDGSLTAGSISLPSTGVDVGQAAQMVDGVQVIIVTAGPTGYRPERIEVQAGVPVRMIFKRTTPSGCAEQIQIPAFDVEKTDLPLNEDVEIEFTPSETGEFTFACGMDMMKGALVVRS